jgi:hypothetical protein
VPLSDFAKLKGNPEAKTHCKPHAIVSFWQYENNNFNCYKYYRIENPLLSVPNFEKIFFKTFLHLGSN